MVLTNNLTRCFVPPKTRFQISCLIEMTNVTPWFYGPFFIRHMEYVYRCIKHLSYPSVWASPLVEWSNDTTMGNHNYSLSYHRDKQQFRYLNQKYISLVILLGNGRHWKVNKVVQTLICSRCLQQQYLVIRFNGIMEYIEVPMVLK